MSRYNFTLTEADYRMYRQEFLEAFRAISRQDVRKELVRAFIGSGFFMGLVYAYATSQPWLFGDGTRTSLFLVILAIGGIATLYSVRWTKSPRMAEYLAKLDGEAGFALQEQGLLFWSPRGKKSLSWGELISVHETANNLLFQYGTYQSLFVPKRIFSGEQEKLDLLSRIESSWRSDPANQFKPELPRIFQSRFSLYKREARATWLNLVSALRLVSFLKVEATHFRVSYRQAWQLGLIGFFVPLAGSYGLNHSAPIFNPFGVTTHLSSVLLALLASVWVSLRLGARQIGLSVFVILSAAAVWMGGAFYLANMALTDRVLNSVAVIGISYGWGLIFVYVLWWIAVFARILKLLFLLPGHMAVQFASLMAMISLGIPMYLPMQGMFYSLPPDDEANALPQYRVEDVYYRQADLMKQAVKSLKSGHDGKTDLYLLAFAGYGDEKVFTREVDFVRNQFDRSFGTAGRSIILGNSPDTVQTRPLANIHNLTQALSELSRKMDREQDILFLFMTSHGSKNAGLSVQMGDMGLQDIEPEELKNALDEAGIKNRVVVVSACYSGQFVDQLKDANSLVISSAARDRTSFGCGDQTEFTYFDEAYFKHALSKQASFVTAFDLATQEVRQREKAENIKPSHPQIFIGEAIGQKLAQLQWK